MWPCSEWEKLIGVSQKGRERTEEQDIGEAVTSYLTDGQEIQMGVQIQTVSFSATREL
jgi:hypothetical protein